MNTEPASYKYDLGKGVSLEAFSIDPKLKKEDLELLLSSKDGTAQPNFKAIAQNIPLIAHLQSLDDLEVRLDLEKEYRVPQQLQAYREAVGKNSDAKGRHNGPVALVDGPLDIPLQLFRGGYYDFIATKLKAIPHDFVPNQYPAGKTVEQLFNEWGLHNEERARYLGFAYLMLADDGRELTFVQRAKGMAIAPDCISVPGSTPNPKFAPDFNFQQYCREHIQEEINEEFRLADSEFKVGGLYLFDDKREVPFAAIEIRTPLATRVIAERIYGDAQAIKEHPVIYSMPPEGVDLLLQRFSVFPSTVQVFGTLAASL